MAAKLDFIIGAAGSGKSTELTRRLIASLGEGGGVYLIVPEQNAVAAESRLAELTEGLDVSGLEVVNFTRLCNLIFRKLGGLAYNYADAGARTVAMWRTLDELSGLLAEYKITPDNSRRWAQLMLGESVKLKARGITPAMLEGAANRMPPEYSRLKNKLSDLSLICASYSRLLAGLYDDSSDDIARATELIRGQNFFAGCGVWLDAFDGFTQEQYSFIREVMRSAKQVTVALCYPPQTMSPAFDTVRQTENTLHRIASEVGAEIGSATLLHALPRYKNPATAHIAACLWDEEAEVPASPITDAASAVRIVECADRYEEAELAAAEITRFVQSGGRWRDCAVIARNIADYEGIIDTALERAAAPYFMSARTDVSSRPAIKFTLSALAVIAGGWRWTDVISMLRTGMAGITPDDCDILEGYLTTWRVSGARRWTAEYEWRMNPDGYTDVITERGEKILAVVNALRTKIVPPLMSLSASFTTDVNVPIQREKSKAIDYPEPGDTSVKGNIKSVSASLYKLLCDFGVPDRLTQKEGVLARQIWDAITGALDTAVTVAGDATVTADQYSQLLSAILRQATVARIPASVDEVTVGQSDRLRTGELKLAVLLGASEGIFPGKTESGDEVFTSSELDILKQAGLDPSDDAEYKASAELFGFYRAASTPSERLVVTYAGAVRGFDGKEREAKPSSGVERLLAMFPEITVEKYSDIPDTERIWSRESAFELAVAQPGTAAGEALRRLLSADYEGAALFESVKKPLVDADAQLSPELASQIFRGDLALTQSRLDSYVLCAFGYYCKYMLELREPAKAEFGGADVGNFTHRVLERFMRAAMTPDGRLDTSMTRAERGKLADAIITEYVDAAFGQGEERSARADSLFRRLRRTALLVIENLVEEFSQSDFAPRWFELPIARGGETSDGALAVEPLRIPLPDGGAAYVYGKIDRVDVYKRGGDMYLRVIDYKTGVKKFSLSDLALGLNMQLLLYLFSLWNGGKNLATENGRVLPAGMLYMSAGTPRVDAGPSESEDEITARAGGELKRSGILLDDEEVLRAMEKKLEKKYIPVHAKKDGGIVSALPLESIAGFGVLMRRAESTVAEIGGQMKQGRASAQPLRNNMHDACEYCPYGAVCRTRKR